MTLHIPLFVLKVLGVNLVILGVLWLFFDFRKRANRRDPEDHAD